MVVFASLFVILLVVLVGASSHPAQFHHSSRGPGTLVLTPIGIARGTTPISGISRFAVRYASALRWQNAEVAGTWELPNNSSDPTMFPLACPQSSLGPSQYSEDCLSMLLYVPADRLGLQLTRIPVILWIHGGSFVRGSATAPELDGTSLSSGTGAIVVVIQYRLGALAFNSPDGRTNFAVGDVIACLEFLRTVLPSFNGDVSKITLAGQSSGANLIRALLATPSAAALFHSAVLHSDPMDYGFLSAVVQSKLQQYFNELVNCSSTDPSCASSLSLDVILSAQDVFCNNAWSIDPSATSAEPMRPVHDDSLITTTLDSTSTFPHISKSIILSTVRNEAGPAIYSTFNDPVDTSSYTTIVHSSLGEPRASNLLSSPYYQVPGGPTADTRVQLEKMGTDQVWRCATWTFARNWIQHGGKAFVGRYTVGATYPDNSDIPFCSEDGVVCHEDDIKILFGTVSNPTLAQSSLIKEVQARYKSFLLTGNPNPSDGCFPQWSPATAGNFSAQNLGSPGTAAIDACNTQYWGADVPYDYQIYGI